MMQTVEAEVNVDGTVTLLEPLQVKVKTRALVTLLDSGSVGKGNVSSVLDLLQSAEFKNRRSYPAQQIEAEIEDARNSWE